jgi:hypothetical protein
MGAYLGGRLLYPLRYIHIYIYTFTREYIKNNIPTPILILTSSYALDIYIILLPRLRGFFVILVLGNVYMKVRSKVGSIVSIGEQQNQICFALNLT